MIDAWDDPPGPRRWSPVRRRLALLAAIALALAALIHFEVDIGPSSLDRLYELQTGKRSPARPPR